MHQIPQINDFLELCREIQKSFSALFNHVAHELNIQKLFENEQPLILIKVIKYLDSYKITRPHYDGSAFTFFLDSTDNQSLFVSTYKSAYTIDDFSSPIRQFHRSEQSNSIILIPGIFLTEFGISPTPHVVLPSGSTRYATVAFAMPQNYSYKPLSFSPLISIKRLNYFF